MLLDSIQKDKAQKYQVFRVILEAIHFPMKLIVFCTRPLWNGYCKSMQHAK